MKVRNPRRTQQTILEAGYFEFQRVGVRSARVEAILAGTGVTKGAFYHHFPTKLALAEAVVDAVVWPGIEARWLDPVRDADRPLDALTRAVRGLEAEGAETLADGCPLGNLLHDLAKPGPDARLRDLLLARLDDWRTRWADDLLRGQRQGQVRHDLHPGVTADFLIATWHGLAATARAEQSPARSRRLLRTYATLIDTLRAVGRD